MCLVLWVPFLLVCYGHYKENCFLLPKTDTDTDTHTDTDSHTDSHTQVGPESLCLVGSNISGVDTHLGGLRWGPLGNVLHVRTFRVPDLFAGTPSQPKLLDVLQVFNMYSLKCFNFNHMVGREPHGITSTSDFRNASDICREMSLFRGDTPLWEVPSLQPAESEPRQRLGFAVISWAPSRFVRLGSEALYALGSDLILKALAQTGLKGNQQDRVVGLHKG